METMKTSFDKLRMRKSILLALAGLLLFAAGAIAQTSIYLPVPSGIFSAKGALLVSQDQNNVTGIAAVASGQVLTSAGTGALPAWSASPTLTGVTAATGSFSTSATVGGGTAITKIVVYSQTITPASVAAAVCAEQTFTVTGLTTADKVLYNPPATGNATSAAQARVSAANTLAVMYCNPTAGALTPGAGTGIVVAFRS